MKKWIISLLAMVMALSVMAGCSQEKEPAPEPEPPVKEETEIKLEPEDKPETKPEVQPEEEKKPEDKPKVQPEPAPEVKPEPEPAPAPQPEEQKDTVKPLPETEPKPAPEPEKEPAPEKDEDKDEDKGEASSGDKREDEAREAARCINKERKKVGAGALTFDKTLSKMAQVRAKEQKKSFGHVRPSGNSWETIFSDYGYSAKVFRCENTYWHSDYATPEKVVQEWMESSGHRANMLNKNAAKIGIGTYKDSTGHYWVMLAAQ